MLSRDSLTATAWIRLPCTRPVQTNSFSSFPRPFYIYRLLKPHLRQGKQEPITTSLTVSRLYPVLATFLLDLFLLLESLWICLAFKERLLLKSFLLVQVNALRNQVRSINVSCATAKAYGMHHQHQHHAQIKHVSETGMKPIHQRT